jgi:hypothetical protein
LPDIKRRIAPRSALSEADDSATRLVATHIIELAQRGIVNADDLFSASRLSLRPARDDSNAWRPDSIK